MPPTSIAAATPSGPQLAGECPEKNSLPTGWRAWVELTKPRLSVLSVVTALVGYWAARPGWQGLEFLSLVVGTLLSAGGALTLNQWYEADTDALMQRTRLRPIPSGRIQRPQALLVGLALGALGCAVLWEGNNGLAALLSAATIGSYVLVYTPLKRHSRWAMEIGAVSGSLPPLIGWAAAEGELTALGWLLFGVLTCWQMPHFLAIAWTYRKDYEAAHLPLHSVEEGRGRVVALGALVWTVALLLTSLAPQFIGATTWVYTAGSFLIGAWFLMPAWSWWRTGTDEAARKVFMRSLAYLPLWMLVLALDRLVLLPLMGT